MPLDIVSSNGTLAATVPASRGDCADRADEITRFAIYPSIGIARVGNSPDGFFFGPEVPGWPRERIEYRDERGAIKRQAARFRIYGMNARGEAVKEIGADDARITWSVEVANKKAAWYTFTQPLDLANPEKPFRRNADLTGAERDALAITPKAVTISGKGVNRDGDEPPFALRGQFLGKDVYLGEVRTDDEGRLIFLGGRGVSASPDGSPLSDGTDNERWHDDVSDGPIEATVEYRGRSYQATGAWVIVGPPDYAPGVQGIVTGYDVIFEVATRLDPSLLPERPSFFEHIYPLLRRFTATQWVNAGFARDFGFGTPADFTHHALVSRLDDRSDAARPLRAAILRWFRRPGQGPSSPRLLPPCYGEGPSSPSASSCMAVLPIQYGWLQQWAAGDFVDDAAPAPRPWEALSAAEQVRLIDRGVLDETLGGPFHPGAELPWAMRRVTLYELPFRIKRRTAAEGTYPDPLPPSVALAEDGPLDGSSAGDITRWMAVPWQADSATCGSAYVADGYDTGADDYLPTFWPARVPNDVLSAEQYAVLMDAGKSVTQREDALSFDQRRKWLRGMDAETAMNRFVEDWAALGIVEARPGPGGVLPDEVWVETGRSLVADPPPDPGDPTPAEPAVPGGPASGGETQALEEPASPKGT